MTVATIKCGKCGKELLVVESENGDILFVDPCPTCLSAEYEAGMDDSDSEWETVNDSSWDDDEEDEDDYDDEEDEDDYDDEDWDEDEEEDLP
jgi:hypothetical protein